MAEPLIHNGGDHRANAKYDTFSVSSAQVTDNAALKNSAAKHVEIEATPPVQSQSTFIPTLLIISSSLFFSFMHCAVRYTTTTFHTSPLFVVFFRGAVQVILSTAVVAAYRDFSMFTELTRHTALLVSLRGILGSVSMLCKYASLSLIPVAITISLFATMPVFAMLLGYFILSEKRTAGEYAALVIITIGAVVVGVSQPSEAISSVSFSHVYGVVLALAGALAAALVFVTMRAMGTKVHFLMSVLTLGISAAISSFIAHAVQNRDVAVSLQYFAHKLLYAQKGEWLGLMGVGCFAFLAALCFNRGAQLLPAGRTGLFRSADIPINFVIGFLVLGELPTAGGQLVGCAMIALSTGVLAYRSFLEQSSGQRR